MGTLTMALAAALLAGSVPAGEPAEIGQVLDLRGEWAGTYCCGRWQYNARLADGVLSIGRNRADSQPVRFVEAGKGILSMRRKGRSAIHGAYRQDKDCITITFPPGAGTRAPEVLTLRRVRPRK